MLEVRNLTKCYNNIPVVERASFVIRPGEILGYLGPNGAGKSTTVKMLAGLIEPTSGSIEFNGQDVCADLKAFQRRLGYVPEEPHLYPHLSGREYLQLVGRLRGIAHAKRHGIDRGTVRAAKFRRLATRLHVQNEVDVALEKLQDVRAAMLSNSRCRVCGSGLVNSTNSKPSVPRGLSSSCWLMALAPLLTAPPSRPNIR